MRLLLCFISSIEFHLQARLDRKSTRLNSSHTVISYAVFCLQKKSISLNSSYNVISYPAFSPNNKDNLHHLRLTHMQDAPTDHSVHPARLHTTECILVTKRLP